MPKYCNASPYVGARHAVPLHSIEHHQHNKTMPPPTPQHHHTSVQSKQLYGQVLNLPLHIKIQHNDTRARRAVPPIPHHHPTSARSNNCTGGFRTRPYTAKSNIRMVVGHAIYGLPNHQGTASLCPYIPMHDHTSGHGMPCPYTASPSHIGAIQSIVGAGSEPAPTRRNSSFGWCSGAPSPVFPTIRAQHRCAPTLQCITVRWGTACRAPTSHRTSSDRRTLDGYWMHLRKRCSMYVPRFSC
jgi:hypothetical protein